MPEELDATRSGGRVNATDSQAPAEGVQVLLPFSTPAGATDESLNTLFGDADGVEAEGDHVAEPGAASHYGGFTRPAREPPAADFALRDARVAL